MNNDNNRTGTPPTGVASSRAQPPSASAWRSRRTSARPASSVPRTVPPGRRGRRAARRSGRRRRQPVRHRRGLDGRRGDLRRRLRHRLRRSSPPTSSPRSTRARPSRSRPSTQIATELQPRFVGGNPPDLIDNSGAQAIGLTTILDQLEDLTDVIDAPNLEGVTDPRHAVRRRARARHVRRQAGRDQLRPHGVRGVVLEQPVRGERLDAADHVGRGQGARRRGGGAGQVPVPAGARRRRPTTGRCAVESAIKEGGDEVRLAIENLEEGAWSHPGRAGGVHRAQGDHRRRLHEAGWRRHAVHPGPGPVEPRPGRPAVPVGLVDRERDEGADGRGLRR